MHNASLATTAPAPRHPPHPLHLDIHTSEGVFSINAKYQEYCRNIIAVKMTQSASDCWRCPRGALAESGDADGLAAPPGNCLEALREDLAGNLSPYAVARAVGVPRTRIERLANEQTPVTADTALRLARYLGTSAAFWMNIQARFDLRRAEDEVSAELWKIVAARGVKSAA